MKINQLLTLIGGILLTTQLLAQKPPMKYGKVELADLEMKSYALDTTADAVVLCDYGYFDGNSFNFTEHLRIKIFKKSGIDWGSRIIRAESKGAIKGCTYNLENGKIIESKLKSENIFQERVYGQMYRFRIAMPNVKEGSIFEIQYNIPGLPYEWYFQRRIPVLWSELRIDDNPYVQYNKNMFGFERLYINTPSRWVAKDMPAFREEPFINSIENYLTKFEFNITLVNIPGYVFKDFSSTWDAINTTLLEDKDFGQVEDLGIFLSGDVSDIEKQYSTDKDKIKAAYERIKKIKWNEDEDMVPSSSFSYIYSQKVDNSADINLMLVKLLRKLDFKAYPVVLSTRENGILSPFIPSINKLDYVIAYVKTDSAEYLLDATEELMPLGLIPKRCINFQGRLVDHDFSKWVNLSTNKKDKEMINSDLVLDESGTLTGSINNSRVDYAAFNFRKAYKKYNDAEEYIKDFENERTGCLVDSFKFQNIDSIYKPVNDIYYVTIKNRANIAGDNIYINPMLWEQLEETPFKMETRKYPVDFAYQTESIYILKLTIPSNYSIIQLPKRANIQLPDKSANYLYDIQASGNLITITSKLLINKPIFNEDEYELLRELYNQLIKKEAEMITLKKKSQ